MKILRWLIIYISVSFVLCHADGFNVLVDAYHKFGLSKSVAVHLVARMDRSFFAAVDKGKICPIDVFLRLKGMIPEGWTQEEQMMIVTGIEDMVFGEERRSPRSKKRRPVITKPRQLHAALRNLHFHPSIDCKVALTFILETLGICLQIRLDTWKVQRKEEYCVSVCDYCLHSGQKIKSSCGHKYHRGCLSKFAKRLTATLLQCPICGAGIPFALEEEEVLFGFRSRSGSENSFSSLDEDDEDDDWELVKIAKD